ncbi:hypothetical protein [Agaribacterium sp. ZY112]|uniref:hypothetical protein n=1 Tax=Agaribacterium sp. ZY112 TaxID=3233574 RepID=UPI003523DC2A
MQAKLSRFRLFCSVAGFTLLSTVISSSLQAQTIGHSSGMCLSTENNSASPANGSKVVLSNSCSGLASQFSWTSGGSIKHLPSNKCVHPGGASIPENGTNLVLWDGCDFADRVRFNRSVAGSMQQVSSNMCVHPNGGSANPANGTNLVMWSGCGETRLAFTPQTSSDNNQPVAGVASRSALVSAINNANAGDVITLSANFAYQEAITITKSITIEGNGKTINHSVPTSGAYAEFTPAFVIAANNVVLRNLTINGNNRNGSNTLVEMNNKGTTRSNNFSLYNVTLMNATAGLRNQGLIPSNLSVQKSTFRNLNKGIDLTRDASLATFNPTSTNLYDTAGQRLYYQSAGSLIIKENRFFVDAGQLSMQVGVQIDAGNDGFNAYEAPGFPTNTQAYRGANNYLITKFNGGVISHNTGQASSDPVRASEFPIAVAKVADVSIEHNYVETIGTTSDQYDFSSGINVEHMSRDVTVQNNTVAVNRVVNGDQNNQAISVLPFQDHGSNANSADATVGVKVINNVFYGSARSGIFALAFRNLEIDGNDFSNFTVSRQGLSTFNLFNTDDNGNGALDAAERSTLTGSFVNIGASSNLGASGLVEATLFNTEDPSTLPPDQRH